MRFFSSLVPSGVYQFIKVTYRIIVHYPVHAISYILLFQIGKNTVYGKKPLLAAYNQCPVNDYKITFEMNCYPQDELYEYYHVIKNVDSLQDVQYFIFGEFHNNLTHHLLKRNFTKKFGGTGDLVLFEGIDSSVAIQCSSVGTAAPYYAIDYRDLSNPVDMSTYEMIKIDEKAGVIRWRLGDRFFCRGWDNMRIYNKYRPRMIFLDNILQQHKLFLKEYNRIWDNLYDIGTSLWPANNFMKIINYMFPTQDILIKNILVLDDVLTLQDDISSLLNSENYRMYFQSVANFRYEPLALNHDLSNTLDSLIHMRDHLTNFITAYKSEIKIHIDEKVIVDEYMIAGRNEEAIETFNRWKRLETVEIKSVYAFKKGRNLFSFFGISHLVRNATCQSEDCFAVEPGDLRYEFRKSLSDKPHAILIPKM